MEAALVSVVVPCLDLGDRLRETVDSVAAQTWPHLEIIVVDDGSTDPLTLRVIDELVADGRVRLVRQANRGPGAATNAGVAAAQGKYFLPIGDDLIDPPYVAAAVAAMEADDQLGIVYCRADVFGSETGPWRLPDFSMRTHLLFNSIFVTSLFRVADWRAVGGFDEEMKGREDHDFNLRILGLGRTVLRLDGTWFHYRRGARSVNDRLHAPGARADLIDAYVRMFRTNLPLYRDEAPAFFEAIFDVVDQRNELRQRYRRLERLRESRFGQALLGLRRRLRKSS